ncbi:hypothetical protein [Stenotrophomonas sp. NRRL B-14846]|uniref:hypothetical protein n=1 Tax=Stenotrophomonas sp. NRRL B-14846 TaxID=3162882 RepID=UPI003D26BAFB
MHVGRCAVDTTSPRSVLASALKSMRLVATLLPSVNTVSLTRSKRPVPLPAVTSLPLTVSA